MSSIDIVEKIYSWRKSEKEKHKREPDTYYVTDLVRCPLKREYELMYPELSAYELMYPPYVVGDLLHMGLQRILQEIFGEKILIEVESEKKVALPDGSIVKIRGRSDGIITLDNNRKIGVEIKSSKSDYGLPMDHHIDQAKIYNWLFDLEETILIYVTYDRVAQYIIRDKVSEDEIISRIKYSTAPRYPWECSYCAYSVICPFKKTQK